MVTYATLIAGLTLGAAAEDGPRGQDTAAIAWHTPGTFEEARRAAEKQRRLLMIKGIAFGIDEVGAKHATKGCW